MSAVGGYIEDAKQKLDQLDAHLNELYTKAQNVSTQADDWCTTQMETLRREWHDARDHVKKMADPEQDKIGEHLEQTKAQFQKHWDALETAVDAYRDKVDQAEKTAHS